MKKYNEYMDSVTASNTLHEKLKNLEAPPKKPAAWRKYSALAAALVLVVGLGVWGLSRMDQTELGQEIAEGPVTSATVHRPLTEPVPGESVDPDNLPTMGGYEVQSDAFGGITTFFLLPNIKYGEVENEVVADIAPPEGVYRRDLTEDELVTILNGERMIDIHLDWEDYDLSGYVMLYEDGTLWLMGIYGTKGDTGYEHFSLEVAPGMLPPSCLVYPESIPNDVSGTEVIADGHDGEIASSRRVSFLYEEFGYRFEITGIDQEDVKLKAARLVRFILQGVDEFVENGDEDYRIADIRLNLSAVPAKGMPDTDSGTVIVPPETLYDENGNAYTPGYDPSASKGPQ